MASLKKKITIGAQKKQPKKKADDFTVNKGTGKRTLSGAEASRRAEQNSGIKSSVVGYNKSGNSKDLGVYYPSVNLKSLLPVSSGGKRVGQSVLFKQGYLPGGTRTKRGGR